MKWLTLALVLAFAPTVAHGEKVFEKATNETWDCATDPVVRISQDKGTFGFLGECKRITVSGKKNVVSIASATKLVVAGTGNFVQIDDVSTIAVSGRGNQITWAKANTGDKPKITTGHSGYSIACASSLEKHSGSAIVLSRVQPRRDGRVE